ncbi:hypothetical protein RIF29_16188 [Crotalaria pallida]|uniref:Uncharacterized protein n=1 Tax=Crotalaria pallida TaxID=3830 RepID=A0AAN9IJM4_CROPI
MEPSRDLAPREEEFINSSESGWTTYIGSYMYNNDDEQSVDMEEHDNKYKKKVHGKVDGKNNINKDSGDEESDDDSMASDASSGPSHLQLVCSINREGSRQSLDYKKNTEKDQEKMVLATKRAKKQVIIRKTRYEGMVENKEESLLLIADSAASHV